MGVAYCHSPERKICINRNTLCGILFLLLEYRIPKADEAHIMCIVRAVIMEGHYLAGVPGFYKNDQDVWTFVSGKRGILIPVRDADGNIQVLQVRRDETDNRKYRWVSTLFHI